MCFSFSFSVKFTWLQISNIFLIADFIYLLICNMWKGRIMNYLNFDPYVLLLSEDKYHGCVLIENWTEKLTWKIVTYECVYKWWKKLNYCLQKFSIIAVHCWLCFTASSISTLFPFFLFFQVKDHVPLYMNNPSCWLFFLVCSWCMSKCKAWRI